MAVSDQPAHSSCLIRPSPGARLELDTATRSVVTREALRGGLPTRRILSLRYSRHLTPPEWNHASRPSSVPTGEPSKAAELKQSPATLAMNYLFFFSDSFLPFFAATFLVAFFFAIVFTSSID